MNLINQKCEPCEGGIPPYTAEQTDVHLKELKNSWEVIDDGKMLKHEFKFKKFTDSIAFVDKIAVLAEKEGHHPDMYIFYNKVVIELTTHAIKGLSLNDFILAAKIESIA